MGNTHNARLLKFHIYLERSGNDADIRKILTLAAHVEAGQHGRHGEAEGQEEALRRGGAQVTGRLGRGGGHGGGLHGAAPQPPEGQEAQVALREPRRARRHCSGQPCVSHAAHILQCNCGRMGDSIMMVHCNHRSREGGWRPGGMHKHCRWCTYWR